jgi:hypothetical protein
MSATGGKVRIFRAFGRTLGTLWLGALTALSVTACACSGESSKASEGRQAVSSIGKRCSNAGGCDTGQTCKSDFAYERQVCTASCETDDDCPTDAVCIDSVRDYNGQTLEPFCLRPCDTNGDCPGGAACDDRPAGARYCF